MSNALLDALNELTAPEVPHCGDVVSLRTPFGNLSRGSVGVVLGHYADNGDLAIAFQGAAQRIPAGDVVSSPGRPGP